MGLYVSSIVSLPRNKGLKGELSRLCPNKMTKQRRVHVPCDLGSTQMQMNIMPMNSKMSISIITYSNITLAVSLYINHYFEHSRSQACEKPATAHHY